MVFPSGEMAGYRSQRAGDWANTVLAKAMTNATMKLDFFILEMMSFDLA